MKAYSVFLLSQLALAGPNASVEIATLAGITDACFSSLRSKDEKMALNTALLINNCAALGGEPAVEALTANGNLVHELGTWLDNANDADTLQRLTGVFNHLSRSTTSASALHAHGIMDHLERLTERDCISGSVEAHQAYVGLANMAMANIATRQEHHALVIHNAVATPTAIKSIVHFLECAIEQKPFHGIFFRVYDVLYALDSLSRCSKHEMIGVECGLVDMACRITAEWKPGDYAFTFDRSSSLPQQGPVVSDTHPILELSTDILVHLAKDRACRQRMHQLKLELALQRLLRIEERGPVRERALKVNLHPITLTPCYQHITSLKG